MPNHAERTNILTPFAWKAIDDEASGVLNATLSARRLCEVVDTGDWSRSALPLGSTRPLKDYGREGSEVLVREARPLVELRVPFSLDRRLIRELRRESPVPALDSVAKAALEFARLEDQILYEGIPELGAPGLRADSEHDVIAVPTIFEVPAAAATAVEALRSRGVGGPYSLVPSSTLKTELHSERSPSGRPVIDELRRCVEYVGTPSEAFDGALVVSRRGGDFRLHLGRSAHIVFEYADAESMHFCLAQTMAIEFGGREAIIEIRRADSISVTPAARKSQRGGARARRQTGAAQTRQQDRTMVNKALRLGIEKVESDDRVAAS